MLKKPIFEVEGTPDEPQTDTIWVLTGRGEMVKVEVDDDAGDD